MRINAFVLPKTKFFVYSSCKKLLCQNTSASFLRAIERMIERKFRLRQLLMHRVDNLLEEWSETGALAKTHYTVLEKCSNY